MLPKMDYMKLIPYAIFYAICSVAGLMLIKTAGASGLAIAGLKLNGRVLLGLIVYFVGFCTYFFLIQNYNLSYVFPLVIGLNYVAVVVAAIFLLKEPVNTYQLLGIAAVFVGILLMNLKPGGK